MAESNSKSKLKRRKLSAEELQPVISPGVTLKSSQSTTVFSSDRTAEPGRPACPAAEWWNREQLAGAEAPWAMTLRSALPDMDHQSWDRVPHLPQPSAARLTATKLDEQQRWCSLSEVVAPLPEPSHPLSPEASPPPPPRTSWSPGPLRLSSPQQELTAQTQPVPDPPSSVLSSPHARQTHDSETTSIHTATERPRPTLHSWNRPSTSVGPPSVGERQVSTQEGARHKEEGQRSDGGDTGLQSCPMCLMEFPAGFTQMDCDGHLAQCLSEVNVDMMW